MATERKLGDHRAPAGPGEGDHGRDAGHSAAGDECPGRASACEYLEIIAAEELAKVIGVLGTEVLDREC